MEKRLERVLDIYDQQVEEQRSSALEVLKVCVMV